MSKKSRAAAIAVLAVLVVGCAAAVLLADGGSDTAVSGVSLDKESVILAVGGTTVLVATVTPSDAADQSVSWSSSDDSVATVDGEGAVTAVAAGAADITVTTTDGGYTAACAVTVVDEYGEEYEAASLDTGYLMLTLRSEAFSSDGTISSVEVTSGASTVKAWSSEDGGLTVEVTGVPVEAVTSAAVALSDGSVAYCLIATSDGLAYVYADPSASGGVDFDGAWVEAVAYLCDDSSSLNWSYWGGSTSSYGVSDSATATSYSEIEELWSVVGDSSSSVWTTPGSAVCTDGYTYYYFDSTLYCVETLTGDVVAMASCPTSSIYNMPLAYGDGMVFVPTKSGSYIILRAFDAETLEQLYVSVACAGGEVQGSITYYEGRVYFGTYAGDYYCFDATDTDTGSTDEEISPLWIVEGEGWYNATPAFFGDLCVIAEKGYDAGGATVYLVDTNTGAILDTLFLEYEYCTSGLTAYDGRVYIATSASDADATESSSNKHMKIHSFLVEDGQIVDDSEIVWESDCESGGTQSTPVIYNNRLYIGGGGATMGSSEPFTVIDIAEDGTMTTAYTVDLQTKGTASITTYYATVDNGYTLYFYLIEYGHVYAGEEWDSSYGYAYIYCLSDCAGQTEANIVFSFQPSVAQFAYQSFTISPEGCLIIRNDIAMFCYAPATLTYSATAVYNAIERIIEDSESGEVSYAEVQRVEERYAALSDEDKALVTNYDDLQALYATVTFVYGDTTVVSKVLVGSLLPSVPDVESTDSYVFDCWMYGDEEWCLYTDRVTGDMTLVASYADKITVIFDSNGGSDVGSVTMAAGAVLGYVEEPTLDGYTFGGWYCDGTLYVSQYSAVDSDVTLTALWLKDSTITFDANGGDDVDSIAVTYSLEIGDLPTPTRSGYTFLGWYYNGELFEDTVYQYEYGITLVAMWESNSSSVTVDNGNGVYLTGTFPESVTVSLTKYGSSVSTKSIVALKSASGDSSIECYLLQVTGDGVSGDYPVEISLPLGTDYSGQTVTLWYYVSSTVTEVSGTVDEDGYLTVTVYGASAGSGSSAKVQIVFGIAEGTELSDHIGKAST